MCAGFSAGQKTEPYGTTPRFFPKTEPKPTDLDQCETVITLLHVYSTKHLPSPIQNNILAISKKIQTQFTSETSYADF